MPEKSLNEQELQRVIARAAEIDAGGENQTLSRLRAIAAELNISPAALEQALAENAQGSRERAPIAANRKTASIWSKLRWPHAATTAIVSAGAIAGGLVGSAHASRHVAQPLSLTLTSFTLGTLTLVSLLIVIAYRERTSIVPMMRQLITFWLTWLFGLSVTIGAFHEDIAGFAISGLTIAMATGAVARWLWRRNRNERQEPRDTFSAFATPVP